jgi:transposase
MSHVLKVSHQQAIQSLYLQGWSQRRIARELGVNRRTVGHYLVDAKRTIPTAGSEGLERPKCTSISTTGSEGAPEPNCTIATTGSALSKAPCAVGRQSNCQALAEVIAPKVELGLSAQRIYQDLVADHGFAGSYESVKRFVCKLKAKDPVRVWRMECQPGEELQVDFGLGAPLELGEGKTKRTWVLRAVLSYSRKGYSEAVLRQDAETFLRCLENAFRRFGGVPLLLNIDNLKAAVLKADWYDPQFNPKLLEFCRHYGIHPVPCRPRTPQHKE